MSLQRVAGGVASSDIEWAATGARSNITARLRSKHAYAGQRWCPEEQTSVISRFFFFYVNALMHIGSKKHLEQDDLWDLSDDHKASGLYKKYSAAMEETVTAKKHPYVRSGLAPSKQPRCCIPDSARATIPRISIAFLTLSLIHI